MKRHPYLRTLFNFKQIEMALLFGVNRSTWAMYESNQRDLPTHASLLHAAILEQVVVKATDKIDDSPKPDPAHTQNWQHLLLENKHKQALLQKEIDKTEKEIAAQKPLALLADFLKKRTDKDSKLSAAHNLIAEKAQHSSTIDHQWTHAQQKLQKEVLEFEQKLIESKIKK